jgi:Hsp70 protein
MKSPSSRTGGVGGAGKGAPSRSSVGTVRWWLHILGAMCLLSSSTLLTGRKDCGVVFVSAKAILGVDLGSDYMKVALVQRGAPLEIVTNMHSKRKTEQMILFDQGTRFYGADASSLVARKPTRTAVSMSVMLGRDENHPSVKVRTTTQTARQQWREWDDLPPPFSFSCVRWP